MTDDRDDLRAADSFARRHATTEFVAPIVLRAGAGTGKTATLVARVVAWATGPGWDRAGERAPAADDPARARAVLGGIVAITFTEAAAAEMAERVGAALGQLAAGDGLPVGLAADALTVGGGELRRRAAALCGALDQLTVCTIHAYCRSLIGAHPFELGRHPAVEVDAEGDQLETVAREVVEERLTEAYGEPGDEHWLRLAREGFGPAEIAQVLFELLQAGARPQQFAQAPLGEHAVRALAERLRAACAALHAILGPAAQALSRSTSTKALAEHLAALLGRLDAGPTTIDALLACAGEELVGDRFDNKLKELAAGKLNATENAALGDDSDELAAAAADVLALGKHLGSLAPEVLAAGHAVVQPLLAAARERLRRRGIASFDDLLADAVELVDRDPAVLARERRRIDQLLVDEFQDTDERQCSLVRRLALEGPGAERPGLFVVGDPKQSIYGFRRADLAAFESFVADVEQTGGSVDRLVVNWRSSAAVLDEVGRVMTAVMRPEAGVQAAYEPLLVPAAGAQPTTLPPDGERAIEYWLHADVDDTGALTGLGSKHTTRRDAEAIAADIARLQGAGAVAWKDCALLVRSRGDLDTYLDAFRRRGVPYAVAGDKSYFKRREIIDAAALVRATVDPTDLLALVTWLRSPAVGVPDAALLPLWRAGLPGAAVALERPDSPALAAALAAVERAAAELPADLPALDRVPGWQHAAADGLTALAELRQSLARDPAPAFVERLRRRTLVEGTETGRFLGAYRLANLERFFARLADVLEAAAGDSSQVARALRRAVAEAREQEEGRPRGESEDAVQVTTIHGAKGLEFRCVYLGQLHKTAQADRVRLVELDDYRAPDGSERTVYTLFGAPGLDRDLVRARRAKVDDAERVRTLYVAMTRAKARLVASCAWTQKRFDEDALAVHPESHADLVDRRPGVPAGLGAELGRLAAQAPDAAFVDDETGARFRLAHAPDATLGRAAPAEPATDVARAAADVRALVAARADARARAARPLVAPASSDAHRLLEAAFAEERLAPSDGARTRDAERVRSGDGGAAAGVALAVGSALHAVLEHLDLAGDVDAQLAAAEPEALCGLAREFAGDELADAEARAGALFAALRGGPLAARLAELAEHVLARELEVVLPPLDGEDGEHAPLGAWSGAIDLVYTDPATDEVVVADFKTDAVAGAADRERRAALYAPQIGRYARAVQEALDLARRPRCELWWLAAGAIDGVLAAGD